MWYNGIVDDNDNVDCEIVERLTALIIELAEWLASLRELEEDLRHGNNLARVREIDEEG